MCERTTRKPWCMWALGLAMGLLAGGGMLVGALVALRAGGPAQWPWPEMTLNATATHSAETMAIASGFIDEGIEGLFILDFITGNLQVSVLNPRTGQLGGLYRHNVVTDLGVQPGKQPRYLLLTGQASFRSFTGNVRPAQSIVYVADANTGRYAAYMLPWDRAAASYNFAQVNPLILLGKGAARTVELE